MKYKTGFLIVLICLIVFCSCSADISSRGEVHVVIVALDYANSAIGALSGTTDDALEMGQCLTSIYASRGIDCTVHYMVQQGTDIPAQSSTYPTASNIIDMIDSIETTDRDMLVFYYSGHGEVDNDVFSIHEASMITAKPSEGSLELTTLTFTDLAEALERKKGSKVALIDCCYAGNLRKDRPSYAKSFTQSLQDLMQEASFNEIAVLCSSGADELSVTSRYFSDGISEAHGLFTMSVLKALGWNHSDSVYTPVSIEGKMLFAYGYLADVPSSLTVRELASNVEENWRAPVSTEQHPCTNVTVMDYLIIPEVN